MAEEETTTTETEQTQPNRNPLVTILLLVNAVFLVLVGFFQFRTYQKEMSKPSVREIVKGMMTEAEEGKDDHGEKNYVKDSEGFLLPLESFTANLAQGDGPRRYIRLNAVLKFSQSSKEEEFKARKPQIRDSIITILNSKRPKDILSAEGKKFLKEEIKSAINSFLIDGKVVTVYYVDYQIH